MKRMSIAESTLKKQIERIEDTLKTLEVHKIRIENQAFALHDQRDAMLAEMKRLYDARIASSESRKPKHYEVP